MCFRTNSRMSTVFQRFFSQLKQSNEDGSDAVDFLFCFFHFIICVTYIICVKSLFIASKFKGINKPN